MLVENHNFVYSAYIWCPRSLAWSNLIFSEIFGIKNVAAITPRLLSDSTFSHFESTEHWSVMDGRTDRWTPSRSKYRAMYLQRYMIM